jgi:hypothetical protein
MAEIAVIKDNLVPFAVVEDSVLTNNRIFINRMSFDSNTLTPNWMEQFQLPSSTVDVSTDVSTTIGGAVRALMLLEKSTICGFGVTETLGYSNKGIVDAYHRSKDPAFWPMKNLWKTTNNKVLFCSPQTTQNAGQFNHFAAWNSTNIANIGSGAIYSLAFSSASYPSVLFHEDTTNGKIWGLQITPGIGTDSVVVMTAYESNPAPTAVFAATTYGSTAAIGNDLFYMGNDAAGFLYFLICANGTAATTFIKVNPTSNAITTVVASLAAGLPEAGAHRHPSNIRRDGTRRVFYVPHYNASSVLTPVRYVWDTVAGTATTTATTLTYPGANTYATYAAKNTLEGYVSTALSEQSWATRPHQWTQGGTNYITFFHIDKVPTTANGALRWSTAQKRTMITYSIGAGTADDQLTFHSVYTPTDNTQVPYEFMPISADGSSLVVLRNSAIYFWNFNTTTGWVETGPYPVNAKFVGLDSQNRMWATAGDRGYCTVHLVTPTTPVSVNVVMAATSYSYSGSPVSTTATVNAYGTGGARIATSVTLTIDGANMLFTSNSSKTLTVTTSASADTTVALTINGGGINNISASVITSV